MAKINDITKYKPDNLISLGDILLGSDSDDNFKTKNFTLEGIYNFINKLNGSDNSNNLLRFSTIDSFDENDGVFNTNSGELVFTNINTLSFSKIGRDNNDLESFFDFLILNKDFLLLTINVPNNSEIINYFSINDITVNSEMGEVNGYVIDVELFNNISLGELVDDNIYSIGYILKSGGEPVFDPENVSDSLFADESHGGLPAGTTVGSQRGRLLQDMLLDIVFPTKLAYINISKNVSFTGISSQSLEVGTSISRIFSVILNKGSINNGDNSVAGDLVGDLNNVIIKDNITNINIIDDNSPVSNNETYDLSNYIVKQGNNQWELTASHLAGTTVYLNNKGVIGTNLSTSQVAGDIIRTSSIISGRYNRWHYLGGQNTSPNDSTNVRLLSTNSLLSSSNTGSFSTNIPAGTQEFTVYYPIGKTLTVIDTGNLNNNLSGSFIKTPINIDDAVGTSVNYEKATIFLGLSGFPSSTNFNITIS